MAELTDSASLLCHYTRAGTAFGHIVPSGKLLMSPYSKMRDPFENKRPSFSAGAYWEDGSREIENLFFKAQGEVRHARDKHLLLSFTQGVSGNGDSRADAFF